MKPEGTLFLALSEVDVPPRLPGAIAARIAHVRHRSARVRTLLSGAASLLLGLALVPAFQYASKELYASGFYAYLSLAFSDGHLVFSAWQTFSLSLLESLPSVAVLLVFILAVLLVYSLRRAAYNAKIAFSFGS